MRKFILLFSLISFVTISNAQRWVDIGVKGGWGINWLMNKNFTNDKDFNNQLATGYTFGGKLGFNFNDFHELTFDVMATTNRYKFKYNVADTGNHAPLHEKTFRFNALELMLMYRHNKDGRYMEIGPSYSFVKKASGTNTYEGATDGVIRDNLIDGYTSIVFGFGTYFMGTENFGITLGARFAYTFNDIISETGKQNNQYPGYLPYATQAASHPFYALLIAEANLDFAYMAKAKCKNKRKLILF